MRGLPERLALLFQWLALPWLPARKFLAATAPLERRSLHDAVRARPPARKETGTYIQARDLQRWSRGSRDFGLKCVAWDVGGCHATKPVELVWVSITFLWVSGGSGPQPGYYCPGTLPQVRGRRHGPWASFSQIPDPGQFPDGSGMRVSSSPPAVRTALSENGQGKVWFLTQASVWST